MNLEVFSKIQERSTKSKVTGEVRSTKSENELSVGYCLGNSESTVVTLAEGDEAHKVRLSVASSLKLLKKCK